MKILVRLNSKKQGKITSLDNQLSTRRRCSDWRFGFARDRRVLPECAGGESLVTSAAASAQSVELIVELGPTSANRVHEAEHGIGGYAWPQSHETASLRSCKPAGDRWKAAVPGDTVGESWEGGKDG